MKFAIADPPYLGRAALWYGGKGHASSSTSGRARGRGDLAPEFHPDAADWDDPSRHHALMAQLEADYDGWALAASPKTLPQLAPGIPTRARIAVWQITNAIPDGGRVRWTWEPVIVRVPDQRRKWGTGYSIPDVLTAPHPTSGFVGSKPEAWTRWVLDMLGYRPDEDEIEDLFHGSGSVDTAANILI